MKEDGPKPKYGVIALTDNQHNIGYVCSRRLDRAPTWRVIWRHRQELDTSLAKWFKTLPAPPVERLVVGSVGLHRGTARAVAELLAGWLRPAVQQNKSAGRRRPTAMLEKSGALRCWPSQAAAGRSLDISRWAVRKRVRSGSLLDLG